MKHFQRTINGKLYKGSKFEREDIINSLNREEKDWELIDEYQTTFPQLLLDDTSDFVIDARKLWEELGKPQKHFRNFAERNIRQICSKGSEYEVSHKLGHKEKGGRPEVDYMLTIDGAKSVCLTVGNNKNYKEEFRQTGKIIRSYFILVEKILKEHEIWSITRHSSKEGWKELEVALTENLLRSNFDSSDRAFFIREANMINVALTGLKAHEIRLEKHVKDDKTRDNLDIELNKALDGLQQTDISLLDSDMDFESRKRVIENTCNKRYSHIKEQFQELK